MFVVVVVVVGGVGWVIRAAYRDSLRLVGWGTGWWLRRVDQVWRRVGGVGVVALLVLSVAVAAIAVVGAVYAVSSALGQCIEQVESLD